MKQNLEGLTKDAIDIKSGSEAKSGTQKSVLDAEASLVPKLSQVSNESSIRGALECLTRGNELDQLP